MSEPRAPVRGIHVDIPGSANLALTDLLIDFTGTLALDGLLLPGIAEALMELASTLRITIATADTFRRASEALQGLPLELRLVDCGEQKARIVEELGAEHVVAVGNGRNDMAMFEAAALRIAVLGPEGAAATLLAVADVVVSDIHIAFDLLLHPRRLKATLRCQGDEGTEVSRRGEEPEIAHPAVHTRSGRWSSGGHIACRGT
jgi:soluble P-type ATPase